MKQLDYYGQIPDASRFSCIWCDFAPLTYIQGVEEICPCGCTQWIVTDKSIYKLVYHQTE